MKGWIAGVAVAALAALVVVGGAVGGELGHFVLAGAEALPFALLALFAYLGIERMWSRILAVLWLLGLVLVTTLLALTTSLGTLAEADQLTREDWRTLALIAVSLGAAALIGGLGFAPVVRRALAGLLPLDPGSFVHAIALAAVLSLTLVALVPLTFLGEPPLLAAAADQVAGADAGERGRAGMLRDEVYGLIWLVPSAVVAVGFGVRRGLGEALGRLGLVRPTRRQIVGAVVLAAGLVLGVGALEHGVEWLWEQMGWPTTDAEAVERLFAFAFSPIGAVVVGVTAGLGEELAIRGVLQPRLGIILPNLFFVSLHALQYNWDALASVFIVGLILGVVRQRTNTTTSAVVHGGYDFLLVMLEVLGIPEPF